MVRVRLLRGVMDFLKPSPEVIRPPVQPPTAIDQAKKLLGGELHCNVYLSEEKGEAIIVPVYWWGGATVERDEAVALPFSSQPAELGRSVRQALLGCEAAPKSLNLSDRKLTDWPGFRASKAKSVKEFRAKYVFLSVETINANLRVQGFPIGSDHLFVGDYLALAFDNSHMGNLLMQLYGCCKVLTQAGCV